MKRTIYRTIFLVTIFGAAMAFLESAVVVYLRELYYPGGFQFPLKAIGKHIALVEILREAATMLILLSIAVLVGKSLIERFAWFIFSFAVWDIFYYVFLYLLVDWPQSLLEWDILFLIPVTWVGPVIAPVINSIMMIALSLMLIFFSEKNKKTRVGWIGWLLLIVGSVMVIVSYTIDYVNYMQEWFSLNELLFPDITDNILERATQFIPRKFNWFIYGIGVFMHLLAIIIIYQKNLKKK